MKFNLPQDAVRILQGFCDSEHKRNQMLLLIKHSGAEQEVIDAFTQAITESGDSEEMNITLPEILQLEGVKDYIESVVSERTEGLTTQVSDLEGKLSDATSKIEALEAEKADADTNSQSVEDAQNHQKETLIQSICDLALSLRKPEINLESVEDSIKAYREKLGEQSIEDLQKVFGGLSTDLRQTFSNTPSETVDSPAASTDPTNNGTPNSDQEQEEEEAPVITDISSVLGLLARNARSKKNEQ